MRLDLLMGLDHIRQSKRLRNDRFHFVCFDQFRQLFENFRFGVRAEARTLQRAFRALGLIRLIRDRNNHPAFFHDAVGATECVCALTAGANPAITTNAANAAVPIKGRFTASSFRSRNGPTLRSRWPEAPSREATRPHRPNQRRRLPQAPLTPGAGDQHAYIEAGVLRMCKDLWHRKLNGQTRAVSARARHGLCTVVGWWPDLRHMR